MFADPTEVTMLFPAIWALLAMGCAACLMRFVGLHRAETISARQRAWIEVGACVVGVLVLLAMVTLQESHKAEPSVHAGTVHSAQSVAK